MTFREYTLSNKDKNKCIISLDCEFEEVIGENGLTKIKPISIGMEALLPNGEFKSFYNIFKIKNIESEFVKEHVIPVLNDGCTDIKIPVSKKKVKKNIIDFLNSLGVKKENIDFYAHYGTHDMFLLIQTLGGFGEAYNHIVPKFKELPEPPKEGWQLKDFINSENYPKNGNRLIVANHNALTDARVQMNKILYANYSNSKSK